MQSPELYFNDIITKLNLFKQAAVVFMQEVLSLKPEELRQRSEDLTVRHKELLENKEQLIIIMEFFGPGILDTSYICEFQRALDKSIIACDELYKEILVYRESLCADSQQSPLAGPLSLSSPPDPLLQ